MTYIFASLNILIGLSGSISSIIFNNFKTTNTTGFYRFFYARIMPYLLCKIIDSNNKDTNLLNKVDKHYDLFKKVEQADAQCYIFSSLYVCAACLPASSAVRSCGCDRSLWHVRR